MGVVLARRVEHPGESTSVPSVEAQGAAPRVVVSPASLPQEPAVEESLVQCRNYASVSKIMTRGSGQTPPGTSPTTKLEPTREALVARAGVVSTAPRTEIQRTPPISEPVPPTAGDGNTIDKRYDQARQRIFVEPGSTEASVEDSSSHQPATPVVAPPTTATAPPAAGASTPPGTKYTKMRSTSTPGRSRLPVYRPLPSVAHTARRTTTSGTRNRFSMRP